MTKAARNDKRPQAASYRPVLVHPIIQQQRQAQILEEALQMRDRAREGIMRGTIRPISREQLMTMMLDYLYEHMDDPECYKICEAWSEITAGAILQEEARMQAMRDAMGPFTRGDQAAKGNFPDYPQTIDPYSMFREDS